MSDSAYEHYCSATPKGVSMPDVLDGRPLQLLDSEDGTISPLRPDRQLIGCAQGRYGKVLAVTVGYIGDVACIESPSVEPIDKAESNRILGRNAVHARRIIQGLISQKAVQTRSLANVQTQAVTPEDLPDGLLKRFGRSVCTYHAGIETGAHAEALFVTSADTLAGLYGRLSGRIACLSVVHMGRDDPVPRIAGLQLTRAETSAISEILQPQDTLRSVAEWEPLHSPLALTQQADNVQA